MDANLDAQVKLLPSRSQIFVLVLSLLSGLAFVIGCFFLWHEKPFSWIPLLFSLFFGISAGTAWLLSHKNTDLEGSHPTKIHVNESGLQLETDSRTLNSLAPFQQLEKIIGILGHRVPLPEPDGLVSQLGLPMPEQKAEAIGRVNTANEEATKATLAAIRYLCNSDEVAGLVVAEHSPMRLPEDVESISGNRAA